MFRASPRRVRPFATSIAALGVAATLAPAGASAAPANRYVQRNLVADQPGVARLTDPNLVNSWGLAAGPSTPLWVADNGTDVSTVYRGGLDDQGVTIVRPPSPVGIPGGAPTGIVFNPTTRFVVRTGNVSGPARFIFDSESGHLTAWMSGEQAQTVATVRHAIFKGLALASTAKGPRLYATDFHHGRIVVFNGSFARVPTRGRFRDRRIPAGYAPFGIQLIGARLYVTYAKQDARREDDVAGRGKGFVDVYDKSGHLLRRLIRRGALNAPWGLVRAPGEFGRFSHDLLIGNFGNGAINAYQPRTGAFEGQLRDQRGRRIRIDGLWGLRFGNGVAGDRNALLFAAGPDDESHGLLGTLATH
jgi:uncharacterized protein (TIGR03118 family)